MQGPMDDDTIVAIATPMGRGGVGIVRLSGEKSLRMANTFFRREYGYAKAKTWQPNFLYYGWLYDDNKQPIDNGYAVFFEGPRSYTSQDVVEFQLHGSPHVLQQVVDLCLRQEGVRMAEPGEFTKRAFLAGKIDLAQAEAVADLIEAQTQMSSKLASRQLQGQFSKEVSRIREDLLSLMANVVANVNFPEEDIPEVGRQKIFEVASKNLVALRKIIDLSSRAWVYREGLRVVVVGLPNMGKSSLFNALVGRDRAIVSTFSGTTRDTIDELIDIDGVPVFLTDTAGITKSEDFVENIGVERSFQALEEADVMMLVVDAQSPQASADRFWQELDKDLAAKLESKERLVVVNKIDEVSDSQKVGVDDGWLKVSAHTKEGLQDVRRGLVESFYEAELSEGGLVSTNSRHVSLLKQAVRALEDSLVAVEQEFDVDTIVIDVERAVACLGAIIGLEVEASLMEEIFSRFCIGK